MTIADARPAGRPLSLAGRVRSSFRLWWLVAPAFAFFIVFFVVPVASLFALSLNPARPGMIAVTSHFTLANFILIFTHPLFYDAIFRSLGIAAVVAFAALILGYPLAYLIAKTEHPGRNTFLMILVLSSMQLDMVIRMYGLMVLMGDNGLINQMLKDAGLINHSLPLMYNMFGIVVGLVQVTLPFMVLSLIGIIRSVNPSLEEAARSLGASRRQAMMLIMLPLSMPGILAGTILVFALSVSSYVVPALMGGWQVFVLPIHIYQQIAQTGNWQLGAALAVVLFVTSLAVVAVYHFSAAKSSGGRT